MLANVDRSLHLAEAFVVGEEERAVLARSGRRTRRRTGCGRARLAARRRLEEADRVQRGVADELPARCRGTGWCRCGTWR